MTPQDIIDFWVNDVGPQRWFNSRPNLDAIVTGRFRGVWDAARRGELADWENTATGALALILVLDQFPRNMFRDRADAFTTDALARGVAQRAVDNGFDRKISENLRAFIYMPFMHSEDMADQDKSVALFADRLGQESQNYPYALEHRAEIAQFGRFPGRNAALGRSTTEAERDFLAVRKPAAKT